MRYEKSRRSGHGCMVARLHWRSAMSPEEIDAFRSIVREEITAQLAASEQRTTSATAAQLAASEQRITSATAAQLAATAEGIQQRQDRAVEALTTNQSDAIAELRHEIGSLRE